MEQEKPINIDQQILDSHGMNQQFIGSSCSIDDICPEPEIQNQYGIEEESCGKKNYQHSLKKNHDETQLKFLESQCSIHDVCNQSIFTTKVAQKKQTTNRVRFQQNLQTQFFHDVAGYNCYFTETKLKHKDSKKIIGTDRFIPNRKQSWINIELKDHKSNQENNENLPKKDQSQNQTINLSDVYKKHVLGVTSDSPSQSILTSFKNKNQLKYSQKKIQENPVSSKSITTLRQQLSYTLPKTTRKINKMPVKILDAPSLQDDFYLNLIDWSDQNMLAVGLNSSVYLWNALTSKVNKLFELDSNDLVTSTAWSPKNNILAVGTNSGEVQLWDVVKNSKIRTFIGHLGRIGSIAWNNPNFFSSGSRDKNILNRDLRENNQYVQKLIGHKQQVCGLKWSFDHQQLASGGNDNKLLVWNGYSNAPVLTFSEHNAAVKALAWSPHQHGLLVSGGGTADRTIRFWNTLNGTPINCIDVGSQVCNLMFAKSVNQLVSTHGYSLNEINIWKYPNMKKVATLTGHTFRVLYLAMNPDGNTIVTGAGDETLRFWNIFPSNQSKQSKEKSQLLSDASCLR